MPRGNEVPTAVANRWADLPPQEFVACCHCGLVHDYRYRLVNGVMQRKINAHKSLTAYLRRKWSWPFRRLRRDRGLDGRGRGADK